jgi:hypothetical protein
VAFQECVLGIWSSTFCAGRNDIFFIDNDVTKLLSIHHQFSLFLRRCQNVKQKKNEEVSRQWVCKNLLQNVLLIVWCRGEEKIPPEKLLEEFILLIYFKYDLFNEIIRKIFLTYFEFSTSSRQWRWNGGKNEFGPQFKREKDLILSARQWHHDTFYSLKSIC